MKKENSRYLSCLVILLISMIGFSNAYAKESIIYGGGPLFSKDHIPEDGSANTNNATTNLAAIRASGFTTVMLWTIHVHGDGDLVYNNPKLIDDGVYVGPASWPAEIMAFKTGETSVRRIEIAIGAWGSGSFNSIRDLIAAEGTGPNSTLYKNFKVFKDTFPAIDAISYDDEVTYDVDSTVKFSVMLADMGFKVTLCPYTRSSYWSAVFSQTNAQRPGTIDRVDLQCYAGGAYNNPGTWNNYFGGLRVTPGLWCDRNGDGDTPTEVYNKMSSWNNSGNIAGGFIWYIDDIIPYQNTYSLADYGQAINDALSIDPYDDAVATLFQHLNYGGWSAEMGIGEYTAADIIKAGGLNNDATSVKVQSGYQVTFFSDDNFQGQTLVKRSDDANLVDDGWNDILSSMIIEPIQEPVALWKFNEGSGNILSDSSVYAFNGTLNNMDAENWTYGKQCGGMVFDGTDDYIEVSGFKGITGRLSRSCCAWVKTTTVNGQILGWGITDSCAKWVIKTTTDGALRTESQNGFIYGTTNIADGKWHHIAVVLLNDGTTDIAKAKLYVDGIEDVIGSSVSNVVNTSARNDVKIGVYSTGYFTGQLDEVAIYSRALSAEEIYDMYSALALPGDLVSDNMINILDFAVMANSWLDTDSTGDITCDGIVDLDDITVLTDQWLDELE